MRANKLLSSRQIFRYAVPARTVTKKHCIYMYVYVCCMSVMMCVGVLRRQGSSQSDSSGFAESELTDSTADPSTVTKVSSLYTST